MARRKREPVYRRGDCFCNVLKWAWNEMDRGNDTEDVRIVHGTGANPSQGVIISHAWLERNGLVIDPTEGFSADKERCYELYKVKAYAVYTVHQATSILLRANHYGPWTKEEVGTDFVLYESEMKDTIP